MEGDHALGVELAAVGGRLGGRSEAQRYIRHVEDDDALVLRRVLGDTTQARLVRVRVRGWGRG